MDVFRHLYTKLLVIWWVLRASVTIEWNGWMAVQITIRVHILAFVYQASHGQTIVVFWLHTT